ncbi:MAG: hypothetical protein GY719_37520 [bacterium]|nr:hypothetical protein [bacterium]
MFAATLVVSRARQDCDGPAARRVILFKRIVPGSRPRAAADAEPRGDQPPAV